MVREKGRAQWEDEGGRRWAGACSMMMSSSCLLSPSMDASSPPESRSSASLESWRGRGGGGGGEGRGGEGRGGEGREEGRGGGGGEGRGGGGGGKGRGGGTAVYNSTFVTIS